jgi:hypothetical protein
LFVFWQNWKYGLRKLSGNGSIFNALIKQFIVAGIYLAEIRLMIKVLPGLYFYLSCRTMQTAKALDE